MGTNGWLGCGVLLVLLTGAVAGGQREPTRTQNLALVGGTLIDGLGGVTADSVVLIRGERIDGVGTVATMSVPAGFERVSTEGMTVLPGLWDPHVHLMYGGYPNGQAWLQKYNSQLKSTIIPASAEQFLAAGVTTVRDLIAPTEAILEVRSRVANGQLPGPTILASGNALSKAAPGAGSGAANFARTDITDITGEADARAKAKQLLDAGVDVIKVINAAKWTVAELKAVVSEAHARGVTVTSHARDDGDIRVNLAAGVDEMQHIGTSGDEYPADIVMLIRERVQAGPVLRWSPTVGPTVNAAHIDAVPEYWIIPPVFEASLLASLQTFVALSLSVGPGGVMESLAAWLRLPVIPGWCCGNSSNLGSSVSSSCLGVTRGRLVRQRPMRPGWKPKPG